MIVFANLPVSNTNSPLRYWLGGILVVLFLAGMVAYGVHMVVRPKRHMNGYLRRGGEMSRALNELQLQCLGAVIVFFALWLLFQFVRAH